MTFGKLLKNYRISLGLSLEDLAQATGKTRQYICLIENQTDQYPPPKFQQCLTLSNKLNLTKQQHQEFLLTAFLERIKNNLDFYDYLYEATLFKEKKDPLVTHDLNLFTTSINENDKACFYQISWTTKNNQPVLSADVQTALRQAMDTIITEMHGSLLGLSFPNHYTTELAAKFTPNISINEMVLGIKNISSISIKNQFNDISLLTPSLWDDQFSIMTLSPSTLSQTTESSQIT